MRFDVFSALKLHGELAELPASAFPNRKKPSYRTVRRWVENGAQPGPDMERVVLRLLEPSELATGAQEEAAPSVTRRLLAGVIALERKAKVSEEELASAEESAATLEAAQGVDARLVGELVPPQHKLSELTGDPEAAPVDESPSSRRPRQKRPSR